MPKAISPRHLELDEIIADLRELEAADPEAEYAIQENIAFFEAQRSVVKFAWWLVGRRRRLDVSRMLELSDFALPKWQSKLYEELARASRPEFPGLVRPLVDELIQLIEMHSGNQGGGIYLASIGCGPMEIERQLFERCRVLGIEQNLWIFGIDSSAMAFDCAAKNLASSGIDLCRQTDLRRRPKVPGVYFVQIDAEHFAHSWDGGNFSLLYHSRLLHHVPKGQRSELESHLRRICDSYIEYDDYQTAASLIGPIITAWRQPVLLNGAVISWTRDRGKVQLRSDYGDSVQFFNPPGAYLRVNSRTDPED